MANLSEENIRTLEKIVLDYLQGTPIRGIRLRLEDECADLGAGCQSLYKSIPIKQEEAKDDPYLGAILLSLNIEKSPDPNTPGTYEKLMEKSNSLHDLLKHLSHDGYRRAAYLLGLIEATEPKSNWTMIFTLSAIGIAALGGLAYFKKEYIEAIGDWFVRSFPLVISWLGKTFSLLRNFSLLGIIYNGLGLLWSWYQTFANGTTTTTDKLKTLFFKTLTAGLTISAYVLSYLAAGAMPVPAAILFVLSSSTKVVQGVYGWWKTERGEDPEKSVSAKDSEKGEETKAPDKDTGWKVWVKWAEYHEAENAYQQSLKSVWIKLAAAVFTTIAVGIWSFFPLSLATTIFSVSFIALTALAEWSWLSSIDETYANRLQSAIKSIAALRGKELRPADQDDAIKLHQQKEALKKEKEALKKEREDFVTEMTKQKDAQSKNQRAFHALLEDAIHGFEIIRGETTNSDSGGSPTLILRGLQRSDSEPNLAITTLPAAAPANTEDLAQDTSLDNTLPTRAASPPITPTAGATNDDNHSEDSLSFNS